MSKRILITAVVKDAACFPRDRLGEPRAIDREAFDAWLANERRKAKAEAWEQGYDMGVEEEKSVYWDGKSLYPENPYRTESEGL